jgi:aryl-alcohol dehydrogenase-like predicted oxidoreductase
MSTEAQQEHPQTEYRRLGKSGLRVSFPILGCMGFGTDKWGSWVLNEDKVSASATATAVRSLW